MFRAYPNLWFSNKPLWSNITLLYSSRSNNFMNSSASTWLASSIDPMRICHLWIMLKMSSFTCHHLYCCILAASTARPTCYKWRSIYRMLKLMILLRICITIFTHGHRLTSGRSLMWQDRFTTPKHGNTKHTLMTMYVHQHQDIVKLGQLCCNFKDTEIGRRSYECLISWMSEHSMNESWRCRRRVRSGQCNIVWALRWQMKRLRMSEHLLLWEWANDGHHGYGSTEIHARTFRILWHVLVSSYSLLLGSMILIGTQHYEQNGWSPEHKLISGRKRWCCCVRRCVGASCIAAGKHPGG